MSRSLVHLVEIVKTLEDKGTELKSLRENIDTSTATGRGFLAMRETNDWTQPVSQNCNVTPGLPISWEGRAKEISQQSGKRGDTVGWQTRSVNPNVAKQNLLGSGVERLHDFEHSFFDCFPAQKVNVSFLAGRERRLGERLQRAMQ